VGPHCIVAHLSLTYELETTYQNHGSIGVTVSNTSFVFSISFLIFNSKNILNFLGQISLVTASAQSIYYIHTNKGTSFRIGSQYTTMVHALTERATPTTARHVSSPLHLWFGAATNLAVASDSPPPPTLPYACWPSESKAAHPSPPPPPLNLFLRLQMAAPRPYPILRWKSNIHHMCAQEQ
jgi:hypothetical protein